MTLFHTYEDVRIARPAQAVWRYISDYSRDAEWRRGIREMTPDRDGPPTVGTKVREVLHLGGRDYTSETVVTAVGPSLRYRFTGGGTSGRVTGERIVVADGPDAAVFTYHVDVEPTHLPRVVRPVLSRFLRHSLKRDLRRLRTQLEAAS